MNAETRSILQRLVTDDGADPLKESRTLDFKRDAPKIDLKTSKRSFLEDVCGFANAGGGVILFGVDEKRVEGRKQASAGDVVGVDLQGFDLETYRTSLMDLVRSAFDPRFAGVDIGTFPNPNSSRPDLIFAEIEASLDAPHMVKALGCREHFLRLMTSTETMGADEIRAVLQRSSLAREKAEDRLQENEAFAKSSTNLRVPGFAFPTCSVWLTATPIAAGSLKYPIGSHEVWKVLQALPRRRESVSITGPAYDHRGAFLENPHSGIAVDRVQADGSIETIDFADRTDELVEHNRLFEALLKGGETIRKLRTELGVVGSFLFGAGIIGVKGLKIGEQQGRLRSPRHFQNDDLFFRRETDDVDFDLTLRDAIDLFWQAAGFQRCWNLHQDEP